MDHTKVAEICFDEDIRINQITWLAACQHGFEDDQFLDDAIMCSGEPYMHESMKIFHDLPEWAQEEDGFLEWMNQNGFLGFVVCISTPRPIAFHADGGYSMDQGELRAQVVVGADGSNGVTRRCIFPDKPVYTARVLEVIAPSQPPPNPKNLGEVPNGRWGSGRGPDAYFDFFIVPKNIAGYTWDFPTQVKGQPMRCWGIYDTNMLSNSKRPPLKEPLREEMARCGFNLEEYQLRGHPIRWFDPSNPVAVPRVLLVGDAVGADPLFGEGISMALGFGQLAAKELVQAFSTGDFSFNGYKPRLVRSALGQTLFARWFIASIVYPLKWRWFQFLLWRILKPIVVGVAWIFILNWGKRMRT